MKEVFVTMYEGDDAMLSDIVSILNEKYSNTAVIIPGVLKRKK